jgi:hypothetical protein
MLHLHTISKALSDALSVLMTAEALKDFRLVGGTALSLQLGHRISVDIDMFSDVPYGSIAFHEIDAFLSTTFTYCSFSGAPPALGKSYWIGDSSEDAIKLDLFYTDSFIMPEITTHKWRLAHLAEIAAMKIDVIQRGGRKKDFWDIHELLNHFSLPEMLSFHKQRYEYSHDTASIMLQLRDFSIAEDDFNPICLRGKHWEFIKEDIEDAVAEM